MLQIEVEIIENDKKNEIFAFSYQDKSDKNCKIFNLSKIFGIRGECFAPTLA